MRIGIDARFLTHPQPGGFKTYTENLIQALAKLDQENQYTLYVDRHPGSQDHIPTQSNFEYRIVSGATPLFGVPWREQVGIPRQVARDHIDLFHAPCLTAPLFLDCPMVITVHDMIWAFPDKYSQNAYRSIKRRLMKWYNYAVPKAAIGRASALITVSNAAKESIVELSGISSDRVFVTYEAASPSFKQVKDKQQLGLIRQKYELHPDFILAIGSADPRKNINSLVHAYSLLSKELQEKYPLVIVWTHVALADELSKKIEELGLVKHIRFLQQVSTDDLALLYNSASLFVFPSLYEGFGLPPLEAMSCGVSVVAANNSSIPEIVGDAALLFDAKDAQELSRTMMGVLSNEDVRSDLVQKGIARKTFFSWEKCADETLSVYRKVLLS